MENKLISVVMCVYNTKEEYLIEAVKSILNQTYQNLELIIVDDASSNDLYTSPLFNDKKISIVRNEKNKGPSYSRNLGIDLARGSYIAFMDSDDISSLDRLEKQYSFLELNKDYVAVSSWYREFQNRSRDIRISIDDFDYYKCCLFFKNNPPLNCSALMCRSEVLKVVKLDEKIRFGEDWKLWVQLCEYGKLYNIKEILSFYRIHESGLTSRHKRGERINENNGSISARSYVLNRLGLELSPLEDESLYLTSLSRRIKPKIVRGALDKLISANEKAHYYDEVSLKRKCDEIWVKYVKCLWNPFLLMSGLRIKGGHILGIKRKQILCFFKKIFIRKTKNTLKKYLAEHRHLPKFNNVSLYYWSKVDNFGDYLSLVIFNYFTLQINENKNNHIGLLFGLGSILNLLSVDTTIWGSGFRSAQDADDIKEKIRNLKLDFRLVRGPLTRDKVLELGFECPKLYGDPALLMPIIYKPQIVKPSNNFLIIAHYIDYETLSKTSYSDFLINAGTNDYKYIIHKILQSKKVISSSLHGIILAEAYGIPAVLLNINKELDLFKYKDYYLSTNRSNIPVAHSIEEAINMEPPKLPENIEELQQNILESFPKDLFSSN